MKSSELQSEVKCDDFLLRKTKGLNDKRSQFSAQLMRKQIGCVHSNIVEVGYLLKNIT